MDHPIIQAAPIHEAGHAVCARILNVPAGDVCVGYDATTGSYGMALTAEPGYCGEVWSMTGFRSRLSPTEARICVAMAGVTAERIVHGSACGGHRSDLQMIKEWVAGDSALEQRLWAFTHKLIQQNIGMVKHVASMLEENQRVAGAELDDLFAFNKWAAFMR